VTVSDITSPGSSEAGFAVHPPPLASEFRASYGEGFKAPSLYQLYDAFSGNPALRPERGTARKLTQQQAKRSRNRRSVKITEGDPPRARSTGATSARR